MRSPSRATTFDWESLFEDAPCGFIICDVSGKIVDCNRAVTALSGFNHEVLVSEKRLSDLFMRGFRIYYENQLLPLLRIEGTFKEISVDLISAEGKYVPVLLNGKFLPDGKHVALSFSDMRDRKRFESELMRSQQEAVHLAGELQKTLDEVNRQKSLIEVQQERLKGLIEAKDSFFGILSHDLRSPLGQLHAYVKVMEMYHRDDADPMIRKMGQLIDSQLRSTLHLVDNLLTWSQSLREDFVPSATEFDASVWANKAVDLYRNIAESKGITLQAFIQEVILRGDQDQVYFMFRNLIDNAVKFTPRGGTISVDLKISDGEGHFVVCDSGPGVPENKVPHLFTLHFSDRTKGTNGEGGSGLGLSLIRTFAFANGGSVLYRNCDKGGSAFELRLPLSA